MSFNSLRLNQLGLNVKGTLAVIKKLQVDGKISISSTDQLYQDIQAMNFRVKRAVKNRVYTGKTHLRGFQNLDFSLVRGGGLPFSFGNATRTGTPRPNELEKKTQQS
ncbi:hypothetical protein [Nostoc sp. MG11]|uniref:hypothetical protein n=1 Tax=Nostoc sp. MG11 TaxID=2721166 RepID=UPI001D0042BC|nr:hypothetical protein [Nostoc sp. MG11]